MNVESKVKRLERRVKLLEAALNWYGDPVNWERDDWGVPSVIQAPDYGNPGHIARLALSNQLRNMKAEIRRFQS